MKKSIALVVGASMLSICLPVHAQNSDEEMFTYCHALTNDQNNNRFILVSDVFRIPQRLAGATEAKFKEFVLQHPMHKDYIVKHKISGDVRTTTSCWASASSPPKTREDAEKLRQFSFDNPMRTPKYPIGWTNDTPSPRGANRQDQNTGQAKSQTQASAPAPAAASSPTQAHQHGFCYGVHNNASVYMTQVFSIAGDAAHRNLPNNYERLLRTKHKPDGSYQVKCLVHADASMLERSKKRIEDFAQTNRLVSSFTAPPASD